VGKHIIASNEYLDFDKTLNCGWCTSQLELRGQEGQKIPYTAQPVGPEISQPFPWHIGNSENLVPFAPRSVLFQKP
jgi:hypothetical protein